jgi:hypothetical protein
MPRKVKEKEPDENDKGKEPMEPDDEPPRTKENKGRKRGIVEAERGSLDPKGHAAANATSNACRTYVHEMYWVWQKKKGKYNVEQKHKGVHFKLRGDADPDGDGDWYPEVRATMESFSGQPGREVFWKMMRIYMDTQ